MSIPRYYRLSVSTGTNCPHDSPHPPRPPPPHSRMYTGVSVLETLAVDVDQLLETDVSKRV